MIDNQTGSKEAIKFYSQRAISIATYLGGPLAAGILVRKNYLNLGDQVRAKNRIRRICNPSVDHSGLSRMIVLFYIFFSLDYLIANKNAMFVGMRIR